MEAISVFALNTYVKNVLDADAVVNPVWVLGEVSDFTRNAASGHCYFTLKDERAAVRAVMFSTSADRLSEMPKNGDSVFALCNCSLYVKSGSFQVVVRELKKSGEGDKRQKLELLKKKLYDEGLFDERHKKPIPKYPKNVALITSPTGAALQDILNVFSRRWPICALTLIPVSVQGEPSEATLVEAVGRLANRGFDCAIIARGGGSEDDLYVFNSELLARAVFACETPIISAVGHEIDFTLLDFVSDLRAPTPSAAAELASPDRGEEAARVRLALGDALELALRRFESETQRVLSVERALSESIRYAFEQRRQKLEAFSRVLDAQSPELLKNRGYAVVRRNGEVITKAAGLKKGDILRIEFADGSVKAEVVDNDKM